MSAMANIYVQLINKGIKTIDQVPEKIRDEVQALLDEQKEDKVGGDDSAE